PLPFSFQGLVGAGCSKPLKALQFRFCPARPRTDPSRAGPGDGKEELQKIHELRKNIMYAVMVTGGKQYRVMEGETLRVELLPAEVGNEVTFGDILMLGDADGIKVGDALKGATV